MKTRSPDYTPLIVILGPTAVGKTEIALQLAEQLNGEIVSADSRLFYRGMDIGTAKPSPEERKRVPHHIIDVTDPDQPWSLALFQSEARKAIEAVNYRNHLPFLVGGTGQYIRAVIESWHVPRALPNLKLRRILEDWSLVIGVEGLHSRLALLDEEAARRIDPRNVRRVIRAIEVILTTGERFSSQVRREESPYHLLQIGLIRPRADLYRRIDARIDRMVENGLVDEVQALLAIGYSENLPPLSAIGYQEIIAHLRGGITLEEAIREMKRRTRVFVRRQANWFKASDRRIHWYNVGANTVEEIRSLILQWLENPEKR